MKLLLLPGLAAILGLGSLALDSSRTDYPAECVGCPDSCEVTLTCTDDGRCLLTCEDESGEVRTCEITCSGAPCTPADCAKSAPCEGTGCRETTR